MAEEKNTQFNYLLNAFAHASQEKYPAKAGYAGKRKALIAHVGELERKAAVADQLAPVLAFLAGEGPLDGVWFGDQHPTEKGAFWWRKHLRVTDGVKGGCAMLTRDTMKKGGRYNWRNQPERLVYLGWVAYPGDRRYWHQFALVDKPDAVWSEVLDSDLASFEESAAGVQECFPLLDPNVPEGGSRYPDKGCYRVGCPVHGGPGGFPDGVIASGDAQPKGGA